MSQRTGYVCPRCGAVHSVENYQESLFCRECGSFLKKKHVTGEQLSRQIHRNEDKPSCEELFPYPNFRPFQQDAIDFAFDVIRNRRIGLLSSPCGTGKSISVLTAFFKAKKLDESVGRLLALTRTRNQLEIYCRELKRIKEHSGIDFVASIFKSKREMCPCVQENAKLREIGYRDFLKYCRNLIDGVFGDTCKYYENIYRGRNMSWRVSRIVREIKKVSPLLPDELYRICLDEGLCPYEITKILTKYADIIIGNYNYLLVDSIRNPIFGRAGLEVRDVNVVFDEAHSLPRYAAGILSDELSSVSVRRAMREAETFGVDDFDFPETLYDIIVKLGKEVQSKFGFDTEHVIDADEIVSPLLESLKVNADGLSEVVSELSEMGETVRAKRAEEGRNPISYLFRCADFFLDWTTVVGSSYARYVKVQMDRDKRRHVRLGIRCLDPAIAAGVINDVRSAILMSGTLWHTDYYIDVLDLQRRKCESIELPSPFPRENRLILVDTSVTTKFEMRSEAQWEKIAEHMRKIVNQVNSRVAVYFPSYEIMRKVVKAARIDLPFVVEERRTRIVDLFRFLKSHKNCVVFGVARGKISEGVDLSMNGRSMLSAVIVVGLPYPKKTELQTVLVKYFREKFGGKAMEYAIGIPCLNALAQSAGRLLRSPQDKGIIVMMDIRAVGRFKNKLPKDWREDMEALPDIEKIMGRIKDFQFTLNKDF